jgi:peptide/nickel transport system substrate-binding protein
VAAAATVLVTACGASTSTANKSGGGVVTYAEGPGVAPNYILPLESDEFSTIADGGQFSQILYLPLYWFGQNGQPVINKSLSIAHPPVFSDANTVVTMTLKHWKWSNGDPITARDVIFWMNLASAASDPNAPAIGSSSSPGPGWDGAVPGGYPYNIVSYAQTGMYSLSFKLNASYNPTWYLNNELTQIIPMPQKAWDKLSAAGPIGDYDASASAREPLPDTSPVQYVPMTPGTASSGALGVAQFLNLQSQDLATYSTNPLWKVVDGPFKLSQFTSEGFVKMTPNGAYSGSPKPSISAFEELPFTTDTAEFNDLRSGQLTIGYIPTQDLSQKQELEKNEHYKFNAWDPLVFDFLPYNFTNPKAGPIFKQLYFRQAFQSLVNQPQYIKRFFEGLGLVTNGPVPGFPKGNPYESPLEAHGQVYPYDPGKAVKLLKANGWKVVPGGESYCIRPGTSSGDCGAGIALNAKASFTLLYQSGVTSIANEVEAMQSALRQGAGIDLTLSESPVDQIIGTVFDGCTTATPCSNWELATWGDPSWTYPDIPTGEELFGTGSGSNSGDYSNPTNDHNIKVTNTTASATAEAKAIFQYEDFLARDLPVVYTPEEPSALTMYKSDLKGLVPQSPNLWVYPQFYSVKG